MTTEVKVKEYESDSALFMLSSMFNQIPRKDVEIAYRSANGNFVAAMDQLLEIQAKTGTRPKLAIKPKNYIPSGAIKESPPVRDADYSFTALDDNFDFFTVVNWKTFDPNNAEHLRLLKGMDDPCSFEDLLDVCVSGQDLVVQLPCATKRMKCNFTRESIIQSLRAKPECPLCKTAYPVPGKQPSGRLSVRYDRLKDCESYMGDGSIVMTFSFGSGIQGKNHPHPGQHYTGDTRVSYLPHTDEGKECMELLITAFMRGELFTIGKSLTNGGDNQLTYGSIHLKTQRSGGASGHGWPDNTYFSRMKQECAAKMIFTDDLKKEIGGQKGGSTVII